MPWGEVELESEVRDWFLALDEGSQARATFHFDRLADTARSLTNHTPDNWTASSESCASIWMATRCGHVLDRAGSSDHREDGIRYDATQRTRRGRAS